MISESVHGVDLSCIHPRELKIAFTENPLFSFLLELACAALDSHWLLILWRSLTVTNPIDVSGLDFPLVKYNTNTQAK